MSICMNCGDTGQVRLIGGETRACHCLKRPYGTINEIMSEAPKNEKESNVDPIPFAWESMGPTASRAKVIGGWIVRIYAAEKAEGAHIFIKDKYHDWKVEAIEQKIVEGRPFR